MSGPAAYDRAAWRRRGWALLVECTIILACSTLAILVMARMGAPGAVFWLCAAVFIGLPALMGVGVGCTLLSEAGEHRRTNKRMTNSG